MAAAPLALFALKLLPAGVASALRETSIIFGAVFAWAFLHERLRPQRIAGVLLTALGGALVVAGLAARD